MLKEKKYDPIPIIDFLDEHYQSGDWIYPAVVCRETKSEIRNVYEVLEKCLCEEIVERFFDIYCPNCCRLTGEEYRSYIAIPNDTFCPHCDNEITNCFEKAIIIYKVL